MPSALEFPPYVRAEKAEEVVEFGTVFKNLILNLSGCKSRSFYGPRNHLCLLHSLLTEMCRTQVTNSKIWVSMTIEMPGNAKTIPERKHTHGGKDGENRHLQQLFAQLSVQMHDVHYV